MAKNYLSATAYLIFWKLMKWTSIVYSTLLVMLLAAQAGETHGQVNFKTPLSFQTETITLKAALSKISKQTGVDFAYNTRSLPLRQQVVLPAGRYELQEALDLLADAFALEYREVGKSVLLVSRGEERSGEGTNTQLIQVEQYRDSETQDWVIEGVVIDSHTKKRVEGVTITSQKTGISTQSDRNGYFKLILPQT